MRALKLMTVQYEAPIDLKETPMYIYELSCTCTYKFDAHIASYNLNDAHRCRHALLAKM